MFRVVVVGGGPKILYEYEIMCKTRLARSGALRDLSRLDMPLVAAIVAKYITRASSTQLINVQLAYTSSTPNRLLVRVQYAVARF